jgi:hypothetical protein
MFLRDGKFCVAVGLCCGHFVVDSGSLNGLESRVGTDCEWIPVVCFAPCVWLALPRIGHRKVRVAQLLAAVETPVLRISVFGQLLCPNQELGLTVVGLAKIFSEARPLMTGVNEDWGPVALGCGFKPS